MEFWGLQQKNMVFWGIEVKSGETVVVPAGTRLHLTQVALGESNNAKRQSVYLYTHVDGKRMVMGKLHPNKLPHHKCKLVFHKPFSVSHSWKHGSVYFLGYKLEELDTNDSGEEEQPPNNEQNQGRAILSAKHIPSRADRKKAEKHVGTPHPRMAPPVKKAIAVPKIECGDGEDGEDKEQQQTGKKRQNESTVEDPMANKKIKEEPQDWQMKVLKGSTFARMLCVECCK